MKVNFCHKCHRCNKAFSEIFKVARVSPGTSTDAAKEILGVFQESMGFPGSPTCHRCHRCHKIFREIFKNLIFNLCFLSEIRGTICNICRPRVACLAKEALFLFNWARVGKRIAHSVDFFSIWFLIWVKEQPPTRLQCTFWFGDEWPHHSSSKPGEEIKNNSSWKSLRKMCYTCDICDKIKNILPWSRLVIIVPSNFLVFYYILWHVWIEYEFHRDTAGPLRK